MGTDALTVPAPPTITIPKIKLTTVTDAAIAETIKSVREGYSNKVGLRVSSADGGSGRFFVSANRGQLQAAGYLGGSRKGIEFGGEVTFDLNKR